MLLRHVYCSNGNFLTPQAAKTGRKWLEGLLTIRPPAICGISTITVLPGAPSGMAQSSVNGEMILGGFSGKYNPLPSALSIHHSPSCWSAMPVIYAKTWSESVLFLKAIRREFGILFLGCVGTWAIYRWGYNVEQPRYTGKLMMA